MLALNSWTAFDPLRTSAAQNFCVAKSLYWITSSAVASSVSGMVRPSVEAEGFGRLGVNEFGDLHDRQVGGLGTLEEIPDGEFSSRPAPAATT
jgi:hypothetical protein